MARERQDTAGSGHGAKSAAVRAAVLRELLACRSYEEAGKLHDVGLRTVEAWMEPGHDFRAEYDAAIQRVNAATEQELIAAKRVALRTATEAARGGDVQAALGLLRVGEVKRVEKSGPGGGPIPIRQVPSSEAELRAELEKVRAEIDAALGKDKG